MAVTEPIHHDAIILGGGLVGSALAIALARHGLTAALVDRDDPARWTDPGFDGRVSAISSSSLALFDALGVGDTLRAVGSPIMRIEVRDQLKPGELSFAPGSDEPPLGWMVENSDLRRILHEAARDADGVTLFMPAGVTARDIDAHAARVTLADGVRLAAPLLVAAEGRGSATRKAAGIGLINWGYNHVAQVVAIRHERPHNDTAWEIFYENGPFAILPMRDDAEGRHRSAIVWSVAAKDAAGYAALSDRGLAAEIGRAMNGLLGAVELAGPRSHWPLGFQRAGRMIDARLALVGDAAHGIHPIAGQGVNLGFRDVAALTEILVEGARLGMDLGDAQLLDRYARWRASDVAAVSLASDGFYRLFGVKGGLASLIRRTGMAAVDRLPPLKRFFIDEARGTAGKLPKLLTGVPV